MLDLSNLKADSEWELKGKAPKQVRKADNRPDYRQESPLGKALYENWPPLKMVLAGPLAKFGSLPQQIEAEEFERILTMRKMERDVERLEKLTPPAPPGHDQNEVAGAGEARGSAQPGATPSTEPGPAAGGETSAPVGEKATVAATPAQSASAPAVSSWKVQTEGAPAGSNPPGGGASGVNSGGGTEGSTSFENRMRNAIGQPSATQRPAQQRESPQQSALPGQNPAPGSQEPATGKQEAQIKKPQEQSKPGDLFDWLMR